MFAQRIKIPVCTDLNKNLLKTVEILFYNFVVHVLWNKLKTQWNLHFPSNNGKTLVCDKRDRTINCEFVVNLTLMFSGLLKKICLTETDAWRKVFSNKICHTRFAVFFPLPSCCTLPTHWVSSRQETTARVVTRYMGSGINSKKMGWD